MLYTNGRNSDVFNFLPHIPRRGMNYTMCSITGTLPPQKLRSVVGLRNVLGPDEVTTSNTLLTRLEETGVSRNYARQILARASISDSVWRSEHLVLESGARMYCWREFWGKADFHVQVGEILSQERRGLHRLYLATRNTVALRPTIEKLLACPLAKRQSQRYPSLQEEAEALIDLGAVRWEGVGTAIERLVDYRIFETVQSVNEARLEWAQRTVVAKITGILADQLRRSNVITWGSIPPLEADNGLIPFNNLPFDHVGFSRLSPMLRFTKKSDQPSPTPVAFDVHAKMCRRFDAEAFLDRLQRAGMNKTSRLPILGVIAAPDFDKEAWRLAKNAGLMTINLRVMFGDPALAAMAAVEQLLSRIGDASLAPNDGIVDQLALTLEGIGGSPIVTDLRSLGLEVLAGLVISQLGWQSIELNKRYSFKNHDDPDATRELDVLGVNSGGQRLYAIECKAENRDKELDPAYVTKFCCETVPSMVREKSKQCIPVEIHAEIWTSGRIGEDARKRLAKLSLPENYRVVLRDLDNVKKIVPPSLPACVRLLTAISAPSAEVG